MRWIMTKQKFIKISILLIMLVVMAGVGCVSEEEPEMVTKSSVDVAESSASASSLLNVEPNPVTHWNPVSTTPKIDETAYIHPQASVIGDVMVGARVMVSPQASIRGDEGMPIYVGDESNVQDGVVLHALEVVNEEGEPIAGRLIDVDGLGYAVYVGERVSLAHQAQIHGPAYVGDDTFIGMQALVFQATVGNNCVLEPTSAVIGVTIADGKYVPAGSVITSQEDADNLPDVYDGYGYQHTNEAVVYVNTNLADGYNGVETHVEAH
ncbi:MAG: carbonic anhydrase [Methanosarcinaceae archaeon]|nr:carbonic anhydrase [Methanosarcinaceae archaeon]